jgi:hypothetical protein
MITFGVLFMAAPAGLFLIERKLMTEWKRFLILAAMAGLGLSFYAYLPFSSEQNPPMNWGYPRTMEGFWHAVSRGQYERIDPAENLKQAIANPKYFWRMLHDVIFDRKGLRVGGGPVHVGHLPVRAGAVRVHAPHQPRGARLADRHRGGVPLPDRVPLADRDLPDLPVA